VTSGKEKREREREREEGERKRGRKKRKRQQEKRERADIYNDERGQGAGLRRVHRGYVHRPGRYISMVRTCIYIVIDYAGDHACARAHVHTVRE